MKSAKQTKYDGEIFMRCLYGYGVMVLTRRFNFSHFHHVGDNSAEFGSFGERRRDPFVLMIFDTLAYQTDLRTLGEGVYRAFSRLDPQEEIDHRNETLFDYCCCLNLHV